jgi:hypothetical protein
MPSASKLLGDLVSSAGAISVTSGVANTAITGTITTAQIADSAITTPKIADGSIVTADIANANVTAAKLANTAVAAGTYGGSSNSALITVDAQGRITSASNVAASGYSGPQGLQVFNTPGTFTLPPGITSVKVTVIGGGGGGGGAYFESADGGTGGRGGFGVKVITGLSAPVAVTIGTNGNGGTGSPSPPPVMLEIPTSFGPHLTASWRAGGGGGISSTPGATGTAGSVPLGTPTLETVFNLSGSYGNGGNRGTNSSPGGAGNPGHVVVEW